MEFKDLDPLLHNELRLKVMVALDSLDDADFVYLKGLTKSTAGNLSVQITKLEEAGQKTKIMASGPNTSWEIDGETVETVSDFIYIFLDSKITVDDDCSHEIKRHLFLGRKVMNRI